MGDEDVYWTQSTIKISAVILDPRDGTAVGAGDGTLLRCYEEVVVSF